MEKKEGGKVSFPFSGVHAVKVARLVTVYPRILNWRNLLKSGGLPNPD